MEEEKDLLQKEIKSSKDDLDMQVKSNIELQERAETLEKEIEKMKEEMIALRNEAKYAKGKNDEMGSTTELLMSELTQVKKNESSLQLTVKQLHNRLEVREQELEMMKEDCQRRLQKQQEELRQKNVMPDLSEEVNRLKSEVTMYKARLEEVGDEDVMRIMIIYYIRIEYIYDNLVE